MTNKKHLPFFAKKYHVRDVYIKPTVSRDTFPGHIGPFPGQGAKLSIFPDN